GTIALGSTLSYSSSAAASSPLGVYSVTPSGLTSSNYQITFVDGTLDITKAALSVTVDSNDATAAIDHFTKTYGDPNPSFGVRYVGFVAGDTPASLGGTLTYTTLAGTNSPVGVYSVTPGGLTSSNYTITFV